MSCQPLVESGAAPWTALFGPAVAEHAEILAKELGDLRALRV